MKNINIRFTTTGKPINSLDTMRQTKDQCPESYLNFMKTTGCTGNNFTNGVGYNDFKTGYW